jgi:hypothetical protein
MQLRANVFRSGAQFNGSSGSSEGVGTKTISELFLACLDNTCLGSSKTIVPGTRTSSPARILFLLRRAIAKKIYLVEEKNTRKECKETAELYAAFRIDILGNGSVELRRFTMN